MVRIFFVFISLLVAHRSFASEVYFSPSPDCENGIIKAIKEAKTEIVVAVYSISNSKIISALEAAKKRGVKIHVLTDYRQAKHNKSGVLLMADHGIDLRLHSKYKSEHNKFGVYDGKLVRWA